MKKIKDIYKDIPLCEEHREERDRMLDCLINDIEYVRGLGITDDVWGVLSRIAYNMRWIIPEMKDMDDRIKKLENDRAVTD